jgi:hypothetical protein
MRSKNLFLLMSIIAMASCQSIPEMNPSPAQLLQTQTTVRDSQGNEVSAVGYLLLRFESTSDLTALAVSRGGFLTQSAQACDSNIMLDGWPYIFDSEQDSYSALVAFRGTTAGVTYNLAMRPEDICMRVGIGGTMNPAASSSSTIRYPLSEATREELRGYEGKGGTVELQLSADCREHLCRPRSDMP